MALPTIYLPKELYKPLQRGHPWVYRDRIAREPDLPSGTWVQVRCARFRAFGLWDARSPIAVRLFSRQTVPTAATIAERVLRAWKLREPIRWQDTTAYRWLYGEGDGIPGVVADIYGDYAVVQTYADSLDGLVPWVLEGLRACVDLKGVVRGGGKGQILWGRSPPRNLIVEENGLRFYADLQAGQKTGLYVDQRDNRLYTQRWCAGKRVLNCFAYTGAFGLYALRGGAQQVVSVDVAPVLAEETRRNLRLNGFDPDPHPCVVGDCFELLDTYASREERFDMVILDPPSLARSRQSQHAALRAYTRLNQAAMRCLPPGGLLVTASCTSQVSPEAFRGVLGEAAAQAGKSLLILHEAGQPIDHPVPAHFPEGRYLKFILGHVQEQH